MASQNPVSHCIVILYLPSSSLSLDATERVFLVSDTQKAGHRWRRHVIDHSRRSDRLNDWEQAHVAKRRCCVPLPSENFLRNTYVMDSS